MHKFQYKLTILNFLICANLHMIEKPIINKTHFIFEINTINLFIKIAHS
jgi:hypothetical protein